MNNVEGLVIGEAVDSRGDKAVCGFVNLAPFDKPPKAPNDGLTFEGGHYAKVGRVTRALFNDLPALADLLDDPVLLGSAQQFAVGLLRKGGGMFARFHDFNLADDVFAAIEEIA